VSPITVWRLVKAKTHVGRLWATEGKKRILRLLIVCATVLSGVSLMNTPYMGDEVWAIYLFGTQYFDNPLTLFTRPINEVPTWLEFGNFRPLGRFFEHTGYASTLFLSHLTNMQPMYWYTIQRLILYLIFVLSVFRFFLQYLSSRQIKTQNLAFLGTGILISMTLINSSSGGLRLFPTFYTTAYIIVIISLTAIMKMSSAVKSKRQTFFLIAMGIVAATYNELTNLIIPLAFILIFITSKISQFKKRFRHSLTFMMPLLASFFSIWIPVRLEIQKICSQVACYGPSNLSLDERMFSTVLNRLSSAVPPVPQLRTTSWVSEISINFFALLSSLILGFIISFVVVTALSGELRSFYPLNTTKMLVKFGVVVMLVVSFSISLSSDLQELELFGVSWRETPLFLFGLSMVFAGVLICFFQLRKIRHTVKVTLVVVTSLAVGSLSYTSSSMNFKVTELYKNQPASLLNVRLERIVMAEHRDGKDVKEICEILNSSKALGESASAALLQGINAFSKLRTNKDLCI
jgi:hypothetical protein